MARAKVEPEEAKADMTPMIDCVFQLLIFFLVGAHIKEEEGRLKAFLPKDKGQAAAPPKADLTEVRISIQWVANGSESPTDSDDISEAHPLLSIKKKRYPSVSDAETGYDIPDWDLLFNDLQDFKETYTGEGKEGLPVIIDANPFVPWQHVVGALNACAKADIKDVTFAAAGREID